jgi:lipopolysaccharide biosynthesis protein
MSSICFFATYIKEPSIPYYVQFYVLELKRQFSKVVFITEHASIDKAGFLKQNNIEIFVTANQGYDFGQWYEALQKFEISSFDSVGLVNDSCILFTALDDFFSWSRQSKADYKGMTQNHNIYPHIQSYFIVFEKPVFSIVLGYFGKNKKQNHLTDVISIYEVGLSRHIVENNFQIDSFLSNNGYNEEYSPYFYLIDKYIDAGIPLIKKKIIYSSYREDELLNLARMNFKMNPDYYVERIKNKGASIDFNKVLDDKENEFNSFDKLRYFLMRVTIKAVRLFKKPKS